MSKIVIRRTKLSELSWLLNVKESREHLTEISPILVRKSIVHSGQPFLTPEYHLHCEFGMNLNGKRLFMVEKEQAEAEPGDIFLGEPGVPHWGTIEKYPAEGIVVYF